jgi:para-nitrobenzyl esterase
LPRSAFGGQCRVEGATLADRHATTSLVTPLGAMLDDPAARAILAARIPMVVNSEQVNAARGMTLSALAGYARHCSQ